MTKDSVDFVRQGASIALSMILIQQSEVSSPSLTSIRALGQKFIDAGGRNVIMNLQSRAGSRNTSAVVDMVLFCQFWYWYPLAHCACLAFEPTGIIGLNADLKVSFDGRCRVMELTVRLRLLHSISCRT